MRSVASPKWNILKALYLFLPVWIALLVVCVAAAKASYQPRLTSLVRTQALIGVKQAGGHSRLDSVYCHGPTYLGQHFFICRLKGIKTNGARFCFNYYIAWNHGRDFKTWRPNWNCGEVPTLLPDSDPYALPN